LAAARARSLGFTRHAQAVEQSLPRAANATWVFERKRSAWRALMQNHGLLA
jgi:hypothetical protein